MTDVELCNEVASKVMGWRHHTGANGREYHTYKDGAQTVCDRLYLTWDDAGSVVERMWGLGFYCNAGNDIAQNVWGIEFFWPDRGDARGGSVSVEGESFPRAMFEAALKAVEARGEQ